MRSSPAFFDTSILLGGLIELGPASHSAQRIMAAVRRPFLRAAVEDRVAGGRIYDAHIAEIARLARVSVVVTDSVRYFAGLRAHGIQVVNAAEFAGTITA